MAFQDYCNTCGTRTTHTSRGCFVCEEQRKKEEYNIHRRRMDTLPIKERLKLLEDFAYEQRKNNRDNISDLIFR